MRKRPEPNCGPSNVVEPSSTASAHSWPTSVEISVPCEILEKVLAKTKAVGRPPKAAVLLKIAAKAAAYACLNGKPNSQAELAAYLEEYAADPANKATLGRTKIWEIAGAVWTAINDLENDEEF